MSKTLDVLLLLALPASGKSEVRRYLGHQSPETCRDDFHMGPTVQLDDYPYVHMMRSVSQELHKMGQDGIFFDADHLPMKQPLDWGMLIHLVNEDYDDLLERHRPAPKSAAQWMFDRFDAARAKVGAPAAFAALPADVRARLADAVEKEAAELLAGKNAGIPDSLEGKTVVIEFARGGKDGSSMPLPAPYGYQYALGQLSDALLAKSTILYVWVSPEESRRKNTARADPSKVGNVHLSLHHGVPMAVMLNEYGCDDMAYLIEKSDRPDTVRVQAHGKTYHLPVARFDNREDKTTFVRADKSQWKPEEVKALHDGLAGGFAKLAAAK